MARLLFSGLFLGLLACSATSPEEARESTVPESEGDADEALRHRKPGADAGSPDALPPPDLCSPTSPRTSEVTVHVLPEEGEAPYVDLLGSATKSIRLFGYEMGYGATLDTLKAKAQAGVHVQVILDGPKQERVNAKYKTALEAAGAEVHWSDESFTYMHAKTIVVDDVRAAISTGNYGKSFLLKERNYVATLDDAKDVADLAALFDADWSKTAPDLSCTRLIVSPVNSHGRILDLIESAQHELLIESMQFADFKVRAAVQARAQSGVSVRVILAAPSWITANTGAGQWLAQNGIPGKSLTDPHVHVKSIIVDGQRAYLGSENLSSTSLDHNREIGLVVLDAPAIAKMRATFEADYAIADSL